MRYYGVVGSIPMCCSERRKYKIDNKHRMPFYASRQITMLEFQLLPHHLLILSPPHSSYSARVTPTFTNSGVLAKSAIPFHASNVGSKARLITSGISIGKFGRRVKCKRSGMPGNREGPPVRKTFYEFHIQFANKRVKEEGTYFD